LLSWLLQEEPMSLKRMMVGGVLVLTVVFLSPIAFMAGQRAGLWLTTPTAASEGTGPWPSLEDGERDPGNTGDRFQPAASPVAEV
jgi:hypothetical protein